MVGWRRWAHLGLILAAIVVTYFVVPVPDRVDPNTLIRGSIAILMVVLLAAGVVGQFRRQLDNVDPRVDGLIVSITVVMTVFAFSFYVIEERDPSQFAEMKTRLDALYFAAATGASVGYGDVHAAGQLARALVLVQIIFNVVFIGTAVALLSSRIRAVADARAAQARTKEPRTSEPQERRP
jgi:voltage-gated potassium channel